MNARQKLQAKIESQSTEMLLQIARQINTRTDSESILVASMVDTVLESRLSEEEFLALMEEHDAALMAV